MTDERSLYQIIRKWVGWLQIFLLLNPPQLIHAHAYGDILTLREEQFSRALLTPAKAKALADVKTDMRPHTSDFLEPHETQEDTLFPSPKEIQVIQITKNQAGMYGVKFNEELCHTDQEFCLSDGNRPIAAISINAGNLSLYSSGAHDFLIDLPPELTSLTLQTQGNLHVETPLNVATSTKLSARTVNMNSLTTHDLHLQGSEEVTCNRTIQSHTARIQGKFVKINDAVRATSNLLIQATILANQGTIDAGETLIMSVQDLINESGATLHAQTMPHLEAETIINRGDIHSESDIKGLVRKRFEHRGSLRVKRNFTLAGAEEQASTQKKGVKNYLEYVTHENSTTFVGHVQKIIADRYQDAGATSVAQLSMIDAVTTEFQNKSNYSCMHGIVSAKNDLTVDSGARLRGVRLLDLYGKGDLVVQSNADVRLINEDNMVFPYASYFVTPGMALEQKTTAIKTAEKLGRLELKKLFRYDDESIEGILEQRGLTLRAGRDLIQNGDVKASSGSVELRARGVFLHGGRTESGFFSSNNMHVYAGSAVTSGRMESHHLLNFDINGDFAAGGRLLAERLQIKAKSFHNDGVINAKTQAAFTISDAFKNSTFAVLNANDLRLKAFVFENEGSVSILDNATIEIIETFKNAGDMDANRLQLQAKSVENTDTLRTRESLSVKADALENTGLLDGGRHATYSINHAFRNYGDLRGDHTSIVASTFWNSGAIYAPSCLSVQALAACNFGLVQSASVTSNALLSVNYGLYVPTFSGRLEDMLSMSHLRSGGKMLLMNLAPQSRAFINLASSAYGLYQSTPRILNQALHIGHNVYNDGLSELEMRDLIPFIVGVKDLGISTHMAYRTAQSSLEEISTPPADKAERDVWRALQSVPSEMATLVGARHSTDSVIYLNAGGVFSQNVYQRSLLSCNAGITGALQSLTHDSIYGANFGGMLADRVTISGHDFNDQNLIFGHSSVQANTDYFSVGQFGHIGSNHGVTLKANEDAAITGTVGAHDVSIDASKLNINGKVTATQDTAVKAKTATVGKEGSLHSERLLDIKVSDEVAVFGSAAAHDVSIDTRKLDIDGKVTAAHDTAVKAKTATVGKEGSLHSGHLLDVKASDLDNAGAVTAQLIQVEADRLTIGDMTGDKVHLTAKNEIDLSQGRLTATTGTVKANKAGRFENTNLAGDTITLEIKEYEDGATAAVDLADSCDQVKHMNLRVSEEDFVLFGQRTFRHNDLGISGRSVTIDGHIDATSLRLHGDKSFTTTAGSRVRARNHLETSTDGRHLSDGALIAENGRNTMRGRTIESRVHTAINTAGQRLVQYAREGISHRGAKFRSRSAIHLFTEKGDVNLDAHVYHTDGHTAHQGVEMNAGTDVVVVAQDGRINAPVLQAEARKNILLSGKHGVSVDARSSVSRRSHSSSGFLGFSRDSGYQDHAHFYQARLKSGQSCTLLAEQGGISARAAQIASDHITLKARDHVELSAEKVTLHSKRVESSWFGLSKTTTTERKDVAAVTTLTGNRTEIVSEAAKVLGESVQIDSQKATVHGEKGVELREVRLEHEKTVEQKRLCLNVLGFDLIAPTEGGLPILTPSVSVGFQTKRTHQHTSTGQHGFVRADELSISTGKDAQADLRGMDLVGQSQQHIAKMSLDTDRLILGGAVHHETTDKSFSKETVGVAYAGTFVPTTSVSVSQQNGSVDRTTEAHVHLGHVTNKRAGAEIRAENVAGGIASASGETFSAVIDPTQATTTQVGFSTSVGVSGDTISLSASGNGGELRESGRVFTISNASNLTGSTVIQRENSDTRFGVGVNLNITADPTKLRGGVSVQAGGESFGVDTAMVTAFTEISEKRSFLVDFGETLGKAKAVSGITSNVVSILSVSGVSVDGLNEGLSRTQQGLDLVSCVHANAVGIGQIQDASRDIQHKITAQKSQESVPDSSAAPLTSEKALRSEEQKSTPMQPEHSAETPAERDKDDSTLLKRSEVAEAKDPVKPDAAATSKPQKEPNAGQRHAAKNQIARKTAESASSSTQPPVNRGSCDPTQQSCVDSTMTLEIAPVESITKKETAPMSEGQRLITLTATCASAGIGCAEAGLVAVGYIASRDVVKQNCQRVIEGTTSFLTPASELMEKTAIKVIKKTVGDVVTLVETAACTYTPQPQLCAAVVAVKYIAEAAIEHYKVDEKIIAAGAGGLCPDVSKSSAESFGHVVVNVLGARKAIKDGASIPK
jgi:hypothetical protein